ncbi:MAG: isopentenyl-diphosphate Delta-isomerase [Chitinophagaceae bacterium]|nr:isopentenyl-diphosphate Delta-isomerase [Chitinophagaceae bacterium]
MDSEMLVLVNESDAEVGQMEKMETHQKGLLHRAFSVLLFTKHGDFLLHQRALTKYHSGGLWTNACCGHPRPEENIALAAERRLNEEMGIHTALSALFQFRYTATLSNQLVENELDHVFTGITEKKPCPDILEVSDWKYVSYNALEHDLEQKPERYTIWFQLIFNHPEFKKWYKAQF